MTRRTIVTFSGDLGIWGVQFVVEGHGGAVDLDVEFKHTGGRDFTIGTKHIGVHSFREPRNSCAALRNDCNVLPGGNCWFDAGYSAADELVDKWIAEGAGAIWATLTDWYLDRFQETGVES